MKAWQKQTTRSSNLLLRGRIKKIEVDLGVGEAEKFKIIDSIGASKHQYKASSYIVLQSPFHIPPQNDPDTA